MWVLLLVSLFVCGGWTDDEVVGHGAVRPGAVRPGAIRPGAIRPDAIRPGVKRQGEGLDGETKELPRYLCGRVLADAWMVYCLANADAQKRSPSRLLTTLYKRSIEDSSNEAWQGLADQQSALALRGKRDPGLADECCRKPCYLSELLSYC